MKNSLLLISYLGLAAAVQAAPKAAQPFNIGPSKNIKIDGLTDDWKQPSMGVDILTDLSGKMRTRQDSSAPFRISYDERGILVLIVWRDDEFQEAESADNLWQKDSLELFVANKVGGTEIVQILVGSGRDPKFPTPRVRMVDKRQNATLKSAPLQIQTAIKTNNRGTSVEMLIPWFDLGLLLDKGGEVGFQLIVNDVDTKDSERRQMLWFPQTGTSGDSTKMMALKVSEKPDETVKVAVSGEHERFRRVVANVITLPSLVGQKSRDFRWQTGHRKRHSQRTNQCKTLWRERKLSALDWGFTEWRFIRKSQSLDSYAATWPELQAITGTSRERARDATDTARY